MGDFVGIQARGGGGLNQDGGDGEGYDSGQIRHIF